MNPTRCPADAELVSYLLGDLETSKFGVIEAHVDECSPCQARMEKLSAADAHFSTVITQEKSDPCFSEAECASVVQRISEYSKTSIFVTPESANVSLPEQIGPYRILERLGQGGMGTVYKAQHTRLNRVVAFKVLNSAHFHNPAAEARFHREMAAIGALDHVHIVRASDADVRDGIHYLAMDYIEGLDLARILRRLGPLGVADACEIVVQAAEGLQYAYERNLVHRDLKPSNLILTRIGGPSPGVPDTETVLGMRAAGIVKILDFGLALSHLMNREGEVLTSANQVMGTLDYMAPEQASDTHNVDIRADIYALGATLYKLLTGVSPLESRGAVNPLKKLLELTSREMPSASDYHPDLPRKLVTIITSMLNRKPEHRPATPAEVVRLLRPFAIGADLAALLERAHGCTESPEPTLQEKAQLTATRVRQKQRQKRVWLGSLALLLILPIVILGTQWSDWRDAKRNAAPTDAAASTEVTEQPAQAIAPTDTPAVAPALAVAPFDGKRAVALQQAWAEYLKVPVEFTNPLGMTFRLIPPGEFMMGSTESEVQESIALVGGAEHWRNNFLSELPQHRIRLTKPYYLGTTAVTQGQFHMVMQVNPSYFAAEGDGKEFVQGLDTSRFPVENVDFATVCAFCEKLSQRENLPSGPNPSMDSILTLPKGYRLPTEAEWEFACRAGTTTRFWNGDDIQGLNRIAWTSRLIGPRPNEVGLLASNPFGLYDMHGNIFQMCLDWWSPRYPETKGDHFLTDPLGTTAGEWRVSRGGDWSGSGWVARSGTRAAHGAQHRNFYCGCRLVLSVEDFQRRATTPAK